MISKGPVDATRYRLRVRTAQNARSAIQHFVESLDLGRPVKVLVPAYYGWSPNEGSGVMDPLLRAGADVVLCRVGRDLRVDRSAYSELLSQHAPDVVMLIHYFGWVDPDLDLLVAEANAGGCLVLLDEAHSLLSCLLTERPSGVAASAVSVHKSLPRPGGLLVQSGAFSEVTTGPESTAIQSLFDLPAIALKRIRNAEAIVERLRNEDSLKLLFKEIPAGVVPLNVPVLVPPEKRQTTYMAMNERGFGVVSLYYKLGPGIDPDLHSDSFWLSDRMINLPCHQDVDAEEIPSMVAALKEVLSN